jgi:hypothetical protein
MMMPSTPISRPASSVFIYIYILTQTSIDGSCQTCASCNISAYPANNIASLPGFGDFPKFGQSSYHQYARSMLFTKYIILARVYRLGVQTLEVCTRVRVTQRSIRIQARLRHEAQRPCSLVQERKFVLPERGFVSDGGLIVHYCRPIQ